MNMTIKNKKNQYIFFLLGCLLTGTLSNLFNTHYFAFFIIFISVLTMLCFTIEISDKVLSSIIVFSFLMRIGLAIISTYIFKIPDTSYDAKVFENLGFAINDAWSKGTAAPPAQGPYIYSLIIAVIYYLFGRFEILVQLLNIIVSEFSIFFVYKLSYLIMPNKKTARLAALMSALFPSLILYSAITLRESIISFLLLFSVYYFINWIKTGNWIFIIITIFSLFLSSILHGATIFVLGIYAFFFCFYSPKQKKWSLFNKHSIFSMFLLSTVFLLFVFKFVNKLPSDLSLLFSFKYLGDRLARLAIGRGAYLVSIYPKNWADIFIQTLPRIGCFLFYPTIFNISLLKDFIAFFDVILYSVLILFSIYGFKTLKKINTEVFYAILFILILEVSIFSWGTSNYGTAIRHRQKLVCILIPIASIGIIRKNDFKFLGGSNF